MRVRDLMRREPRVTRPDASLAAAGRVMAEVDCGILPVVDDGRLVGVITDRDVCLAVARQERAASQIEVRRAISADLHTCGPEAAVSDALATMREHRVRRLPVLGPDRALAGILSMDDVVLATRPEGTPGFTGPAYGEVVETLRAINEHLIPAGHA